jgi:hypothetical protein
MENLDPSIYILSLRDTANVQCTALLGKVSSMRLGALLIASFPLFCLMIPINWDNPPLSKSKCV